MAVDGAAVAAIAARGLAYIMGDWPNELVPLTAARVVDGDPIVFQWDDGGSLVQVVPAGPGLSNEMVRVDEKIEVMTSALLVSNKLYSWAGGIYLCIDVNPGRSSGAAWPNWARLLKQSQ